MNSNTLANGIDHLLIDDQALQSLKGTLRGYVITRDDSTYDNERSVYNGMIDRHPALIIKTKNVADVITAVNFGRTQNMLIAVRSGGHNAGGLGVCDDGLVIDLSLMKGIRVDQEQNTVRVEAGCLLGDIDHATQAFGKAVPSGVFSTTGVSGLTLGGGLGHLSRKHGLAIDNLLEVDVVLADGSMVTANERNNFSDLFWAIRGGGGNFGIITSFLFELSDVSVVYGGPTFWAIEDSYEMMKFYRDFILRAPDDVYGYFAFLTVPPVAMFPDQYHLKKMCAVQWCNLGDLQIGEIAVNKFRAYKKPLIDFAGPISFVAIQTMFDALYPKGLQWYWKADFVKDLSEDAIKTNVEQAFQLPTPHSTVHLYPINGAVQKKKNDATAFSYRDANFSQVIVGVDPDPANNDKLISWARNYWDAIHPYSAGGAYVNFIMDEGQEQVKASYRNNYGRLVDIKTKYDPRNLFRINQNIKPK